MCKVNIHIWYSQITGVLYRHLLNVVRLVFKGGIEWQTQLTSNDGFVWEENWMKICRIQHGKALQWICLASNWKHTNRVLKVNIFNFRFLGQMERTQIPQIQAWASQSPLVEMQYLAIWVSPCWFFSNMNWICVHAYPSHQPYPLHLYLFALARERERERERVSVNVCNVYGSETSCAGICSQIREWWALHATVWPPASGGC
jgi:hypothetical protein